ncbi:Dbl homology domain-containing protein [Xylariaceae sp. FL1272]|nr:Dbl homology domain-containing protein [Xylariaceae sp. FL1272]
MARDIQPNENDSPHIHSRSKSFSVAKQTDWCATAPSHPKLNPNWIEPQLRFSDQNPCQRDTEEAFKVLDNIATLHLSLEDGNDAISRCTTHVPEIVVDDRSDSSGEEDSSIFATTRPFHRWMKSLHRRAQRPKLSNDLAEPIPPGSVSVKSSMRKSGHRKSSSDSSYGFVAAVRSATVSMASASIVTRPRRHHPHSSIHTRTDRSSRGSFSVQRISEDSTYPEKTSPTDPAVTERLLQRRRIIEELIKTEESYIGDIKFLMNVYVTILASLPTLQSNLRSSINQNLTDIIELHEEILGELHAVVPNSEYTQPEHVVVKTATDPSRRHHRWRSLDSVPEDKGGISWLNCVPSLVAEPHTAAQVARIFAEKMNRFFIYEEYGARYEMMIKDVALAHRTLPHWASYQKGLEALAASLSASNSHLDQSKKSLTIGDLLVKPIQRMCRYPLLFAELLKYTPVCDCPSSYMEIERALMRLRESTAEINRATDDPQTKNALEQTWLLQDRLVLPFQAADTTYKTRIRSLGQVQLCGALHVCWQAREGVNGQYMVSLLYKNFLCLATAKRNEQVYTVQACLSLDNIKVEDADNGRGLQCHTAPFSWKLVFECDYQLYEIVMTACSQKEGLVWRTRLSHAESSSSLEGPDFAFCNSLYLSIRSLGTVFRKPGTVARRLSIHRATTVGPKSPLCQVILKNTSSNRDSSANELTLPINRSQSLLTTTARIPVLAPPRAERARLEALLADVWSRNVLPFPGMASRSRSEHLVRSGASTVIRKLSVAGLAHSFTKRSSSTATLTRSDANEAEQNAHVNGFIDSLVDVVCDTPKTTRPDLSPLQRLPIIRDEMERASSNGSEYQRDGSTGTVRRLDASKGETASDRTDTAAMKSSRTSSTSSSRLSQRTPPRPPPKSPLRTEDTSKIYRAAERMVSSSEDRPSTPRYSRWPRIGVINRGISALGGRSFFH